MRVILDILPPEMVREVLEKCPSGDLGNAARACRAFEILSRGLRFRVIRIPKTPGGPSGQLLESQQSNNRILAATRELYLKTSEFLDGLQAVRTLLTSCRLLYTVAISYKWDEDNPEYDLQTVLQQLQHVRTELRTLRLFWWGYSQPKLNGNVPTISLLDFTSLRTLCLPERALSLPGWGAYSEFRLSEILPPSLINFCFYAEPELSTNGNSKVHLVNQLIDLYYTHPNMERAGVSGVQLSDDEMKEVLFPFTKQDRYGFSPNFAEKNLTRPLIWWTRDKLEEAKDAPPAILCRYLQESTDEQELEPPYLWYPGTYA
jgi:hypothetical protein